MSIYEKLLLVQQEIKATKDQRNDFGKFNYRNAEQIYESAKPICKKHGVVIYITDDVFECAGKPYLRASATMMDIEDKESVTVEALARIPDSKKGMDDSQLTGSSSSYARKYALGGLLLLDDNKDPDSMDNRDTKDKERSAEREKAFAENQKRLDEQENWRIISPDHIEVKARKVDGTFEWKNLDKVTLRGLEFLYEDERFEGIKQDVKKRIEYIKEHH